MTGEQAGEVVGILLAAYPDLVLEPDSGFILWTSLIAELDDHGTAKDVALRFARNSEKPPTIARFRDAYRQERKRATDAAARERGLPEAQPEAMVPESVREWMAAHSFGRPIDGDDTDYSGWV